MKIVEKFSNINVSTFVEDYIRSNGIEDVKHYLNVTWDDRENPSDYDNMQEAYECLCEHHDNGDKAGILMDVDMDGGFSSSLLHNYLLDIEYNGEIIPFFHKDKKHGLTDYEVFTRIKESGIKLLFCPDSSSDDFDQHKELKEMGIDVIVLDHHHCRGYSDYAIVINNQLSDKVKNKHGSGTLVTHKFCQYVDMMTGFDFAEKYYSRVALSLITDVCDVTSYENRFYLNYGLKDINDKVVLLMIQAKNKSVDITIHNLGWNVMPCFNSYIRNGFMEELYTSLVFPESTCMWQRIKKEELKEWNIVDRVVVEAQATQTKQSNEVRKYMKQLSEQVNEDDKVIVAIVDDTFNLAYTGLVAGKLNSNYGKPALVVHEEHGHYMGSVRSETPKDVFDKSGLFIYNSGHPIGAWGTCFEANKLNSIKDYFNTLDLESDVTCEVFKCFTPSTIPLELFEVLDSITWLHGKGLESPQFCIKGIKLDSYEIAWYQTCMTFLHKGVKYVKFFPNEAVRNDFMKDMDKKLDITIVGDFCMNEYKGYRNPQVIIQKYEVKEHKKIMDIDDIF